MIKKIKINNNHINTSIIIKSNYATKYLNFLSKNNRKIFCIVDNKVKNFFNDLDKKNIHFTYLKCGEKIKKINYYEKIYEKLLSKGIDRNSILVCIGGGTLGDLCGFIASTILRGVEYKLIPTTLLSQVDSSIGGKNGINSKYGKNLIGSFYQPNEVIIDTKFLKMLPFREIKSGYAEIIKHALIKDKNFFNWLDKNYNKIFNLNTAVLENAILKSIIIKLWYVKNDPKEKLINFNSRAILNFGHTIGHSLETFYNYNSKLNHGEAISIGMLIEAKISNKLGYLSEIDLNKIEEHFKNAKLKLSDKNIKNYNLLNIIKKDKKNMNGNINIILLKSIGKSFFARNVKFNSIKQIINST
ncbi:3-dehydroquinate synthase [Pelagibacteraceae bacterium]|nr:3-dehydroquinate synthase [Pelagibacteraceae bacterium]